MRSAILAATALAALLSLTGTAGALVITITGSDGTLSATNSASSPTSFGPASVGTWTATGLATGTPPLGSGVLFSNTIAVNTTGPGTFTLWVTENGLTSPTGLVPWVSSLTTNLLFGGITSVTETTSLQTDDSTPGPTTALGTILDSAVFITSNQTQLTTTNADTGAGPSYSLTEQYIVTATGAGGVNLTIDLFPQAVPEPASLALLGVGLLGLGFVQARRRNH